MQARLIELEIKLAYLEDLMETLHRRHLALEEALHLQQEQLRHLYQQIQAQPWLVEKPPHY